jgi:DNA (cytosine-5)-methyltransferase 1
VNIYNDNDPKVCAWASELVKAGHVAPGTVLCKSIKEVQADELRQANQVHLFAGILGWPLALRLAGWPDDRPVWTGSCPCQPFSAAGKRKGTADERHLWPDMLRLIAECKPATVFGEQVASSDGREWLAGVRADMEALGYAFGAADLCAAGIGAPHIRQRLFWVADAQGERKGAVTGSARQGLHEFDGSGTTGRLADTRGARKGRTPAMDKNAQRQAIGGAEPCGGGGVGGVGNSKGPEHQRVGTVADRQQGGFADTGGLGVARSDGPQGQQQAWAAGGAVERTCAAGWGDYRLVHCLDGKARRIEPSISPLAHGIPARVVRLRGYGNAIVPALAAAFVRAFMETEAA